METHIIPDEYRGPFASVSSRIEDSGYYIHVKFLSKILAEEWLKQRKMADEIAVELEEYDG